MNVGIYTHDKKTLLHDNIMIRSILNILLPDIASAVNTENQNITRVLILS